MNLVSRVLIINLIFTGSTVLFCSCKDESEPSNDRYCRYIPSHIGEDAALEYSLDGTKIVSGAGDGIKVWDVSTCQMILHINTSVESVDLSPDGLKIASANTADQVDIWDAITGQLQLSIAENSQFVAWSPDGLKLATVSGNDITIREASSLTALLVIHYSSPPAHLYWSPDGMKLIATGDYHGGNFQVPVWDTQTGNLLVWSMSHNSFVRCAAWSPDGAEIASIGDNGIIRIWNPLTGSQISEMYFYEQDWGADAWDVKWSPDGQRIVVVGGTGSSSGPNELPHCEINLVM